MARKKFPIKFSIRIDIPGYHKKIDVGIEQSVFSDPRSLFITSYIKNGILKSRKESFSNITELNKLFGIRLKEFCDKL